MPSTFNIPQTTPINKYVQKIKGWGKNGPIYPCGHKRYASKTHFGHSWYIEAMFGSKSIFCFIYLGIIQIMKIRKYILK